MLGDELTGTTDSLENILNRMNTYLEQTDEAFRGSLKTLNDVQGMVNASRAPLESFKKIVKKLKILSISTKIESTQINNDNNGFLTLADDVERLSVLIHEKCKNISENAGALGSIIEQTLSRMHFMEERQHSQVGDIFRGVQSGLSTLTAKHERSSHSIVTG